MSNSLSTKDLSILEDQLNHEALANQKAAAYAESLQDPQLKAFANTLASHHKHRYEAMYNYLNGQQ
ncbi:MAG: spore coat protein [Firmicutes bacterium]|nr:spore coat protein [Bacillota bacterium]